MHSDSWNELNDKSEITSAGCDIIIHETRLQLGEPFSALTFFIHSCQGTACIFFIAARRRCPVEFSFSKHTHPLFTSHELAHICLCIVPEEREAHKTGIYLQNGKNANPGAGEETNLGNDLNIYFGERLRSHFHIRSDTRRREKVLLTGGEIENVA